ncbi:MAG TPA: carboxypeptidase regulatory-like domain-containing protein [Candidatus Angelobacter sp.]|nr:carboxypeptidase regulatory-like domain-containing protein [Candidatus Angelobacter sp.]
MSKRNNSRFIFLSSRIHVSFLMVSCSILALVPIALSGCTSSKPTATETASQATAETRTATPATVPAENPSGYTVREPANGGAIEGRITLSGKPIPPRPVVVNQDASVCGSHREIYPVKVEEGGVVDAVVWIDDIHEGKAYGFAPAVLDQKKCTYDPHIVLMQPGDLKVTTSDPVPHNIHSYSEINRSYNESMNPLNRETTLHFARPERVTFKCDLHGWMEAFIVVVGNPYYAVTQKGGTFQLRDVPPGTYRLKVWQETLGEVTQTVTVEAGKTAKVNFSLSSASSETAEVR